MKFKNIPEWLVQSDDVYRKKSESLSEQRPQEKEQDIECKVVKKKTVKPKVIYESEESEEEVIIKKKKPKSKPKKKVEISESESEEISDEEEDYSVRTKNLKNLKKYIK